MLGEPNIHLSDDLVAARIKPFSYERTYQWFIDKGIEQIVPNDPMIKNFFLWQCWRYMEMTNLYEDKKNEDIYLLLDISFNNLTIDRPRLLLRLAEKVDMNNDNSITVEAARIWGPGKNKPWKNHFIFSIYLIHKCLGASVSKTEEYLETFFKSFEDKDVHVNATFNKAPLLLHYKIFLEEIRVFYFGDNIPKETLRRWDTIKEKSPWLEKFLSHVFFYWEATVKECLNRGYDLRPFFARGISYSEDLVTTIEGLSDNERKYHLKQIARIEKKQRQYIFTLTNRVTGLPPFMDYEYFVNF